MSNLLITPSKFSGTLSGKLSISPSKSHTARAILFSMLSSKKSTIRNYLPSPDSEAMMRAISVFGSKIDRSDKELIIQGAFSSTDQIIDAGNSGQVLRFVAAMAALLPSTTLLTGDQSLCSRRPISPLLKALNELGANAKSIRGNGYAPISIQGPIKPGVCRLCGKDSQPVSALLMATSFLDSPSEIFVDNPKETPWIDLTLFWLTKLGAKIIHKNYHYYRIEKGVNYSEIDCIIPADFSTAAFPIAAALVTKSSLKIEGLDPNDVQGDKSLIEIFQNMGAKISWTDEDILFVEQTEELEGIPIDVDQCIDALPILAVVGCFAKGKTTLYNGEIARKKESDRIECIAKELRKMGANIEERSDGLLIYESPLFGATLETYKDHRLALALSVAALGAKNASVIQDSQCVDKTYLSFVTDFQKIGADIELDSIRV